MVITECLGNCSLILTKHRSARSGFWSEKRSAMRASWTRCSRQSNASATSPSLIIARATAALSRWNAVSAITASQVNSGSVTSAASCAAHWWCLSLAFANATKKPVSAIPFKTGKIPCASRDRALRELNRRASWMKEPCRRRVLSRAAHGQCVPLAPRIALRPAQARSQAPWWVGLSLSYPYGANVTQNC